MVIVSDSETVVSRGEERQPAEKKAKKRAPRIPTIPRVRGLGTTGSNFSDNTSKYLGSVYTDYVRDMDEPAGAPAGVEEDGQDLALEMQREFNLKLAETIQREQDRATPVYAEVRAEKKKKTGRSYNSSYKSNLFVSEDMDATIDDAFRATFEEEDRHLSPVMGTEAVLEKKKKREKRDQDLKGERKRERHRGEKEKNTGDSRERRQRGSNDRRMSKDSNTTIEASHHITVEVVFSSSLFTLQSSIVKVTSSGQDFVDTIEDLKTSDDEERRPARRREAGNGGSRRSSIYFDESDGPFGTWKRVKLDK